MRDFYKNQIVEANSTLKEISTQLTKDFSFFSISISDIIGLLFTGFTVWILYKQYKLQNMQHKLQDREYKRLLLVNVAASFRNIKSQIQSYRDSNFKSEFMQIWLKTSVNPTLERLIDDLNKLKGILSEADLNVLYLLYVPAADWATKITFEGIPGGYATSGFSKERYEKIIKDLDLRIDNFLSVNFDEIIFKYLN